MDKSHKHAEQKKPIMLLACGDRQETVLFGGGGGWEQGLGTASRGVHEENFQGDDDN